MTTQLESAAESKGRNSCSCPSSLCTARPHRKSIDDIDAPAPHNTRAAAAPSAEQSDDVEQEPDGDALVLVNPKENEHAGE